MRYNEDGSTRRDDAYADYTGPGGPPSSSEYGEYDEYGDYGQPPEDDTPVIRHAATDTAYEPASADVASRVGGFGRRMVTIPAARRDGASKGFDHNRADVVHVDPGKKGSFYFDPKRVTNAEIVAAVEQSEHPLQALFRLASPGDGRRDDKQPPRNRDMADKPYDLRRLAPRQEPPEAPKQAPPVDHGPLPGVTPYPQYPPQYPPQPDVAAMVYNLQRQISELAARSTPRAEPEEDDEPPAETPRHRRPPVRPKTKAPPEAYEERAEPGRQEPADIGVPWLRSGGLKPTRAVFFKFSGPGGAATKAWYHDVVDTGELIVLVFDTRFEGGYQCVPPASNSAFQLSVAGSDQVYSVLYLGESFSLGKLDFVILHLSDEQAERSGRGETGEWQP